MTTDVNINSVDFREDLLPKWSTETTLAKVLEKLPKGNLVEDRLGEIARILRTASKDSRSQQKEVESTLSAVAGEIQTQKKQQATASSTSPPKIDKGRTEVPLSVKGLAIDSVLSTGVAIGVTGRAMGELADNIFDLSSDFRAFNYGPFSRFSKLLGPLAGTFAVLGTVVGRYIRIVMDSINVFRSFNEIGLTGINTTAGLYAELAQLGMTTSEYEKIMQDYGTAMGTFGMDGLSRLTKTTENANFNLSQFGLTTAEGATYAAQLLQQQRLAGLFTRRNAQQEQEAFQDTIKNVSAFSKMMNVSRQEIMESLTKILEQDRVRALFASINDNKMREQAQESFGVIVKAFTAMGGPGREFAQLFSDMTSALDPVMVQGFQQLVPFAGQAAMGLADLARRLQSGTLKEDEAFEEVLEFGESLSANREQILFMARLGDEGAQRAASMMLQFEEMRKRYEPLAKKEGISLAEYLRKRAEVESEAAESGALLQDAMNKLRVGFNKVIISFINAFIGKDKEIKVIDKLAEFAKIAGDKLRGFSKTLENLTINEAQFWDPIKAVIKIGFKDVIFPVIAIAFKEGIKALFTSPEFLIGIGALLTAKTFLTALGLAISASIGAKLAAPAGAAVTGIGRIAMTAALPALLSPVGIAALGALLIGGGIFAHKKFKESSSSDSNPQTAPRTANTPPPAQIANDQTTIRQRAQQNRQNSVREDTAATLVNLERHIAALNINMNTIAENTGLTARNTKTVADATA